MKDTKIFKDYSFFRRGITTLNLRETGKEFYGAARGARILDLLNHNQAF
jgi:hypothetical protein